MGTKGQKLHMMFKLDFEGPDHRRQFLRVN